MQPLFQIPRLASPCLTALPCPALHPTPLAASLCRCCSMMIDTDRLRVEAMKRVKGEAEGEGRKKVAVSSSAAPPAPLPLLLLCCVVQLPLVTPIAALAEAAERSCCCCCPAFPSCSGRWLTTCTRLVCPPAGWISQEGGCGSAGRVLPRPLPRGGEPALRPGEPRRTAVAAAGDALLLFPPPCVCVPACRSRAPRTPPHTLSPTPLPHLPPPCAVNLCR